MLRNFPRQLNADDIFISYSREDGEPYLEGLSNALGKLRFSCFDDRKGTDAGALPPETLFRKIRNCRTLVLLATPGAVRKSTFLAEEVRQFADANGTSRIVAVSFDRDKTELDDWSKAEWHSLVDGKARAREFVERLNSGQPSDTVISRIEQKSDYLKRQDMQRRNQRRALAVFICLIIGIAAAGAVAWYQLRRAVAATATANAEIERAQKAANVAEAARGQAATAQTEARLAKEEENKQKEIAKGAALEASRQQGLADVAKREAAKQQAIANTRKRESMSQVLATRANSQLNFDPAASVSLAKQAFRTATTVEAGDALRASLLTSRLVASLTEKSGSSSGTPTDVQFHPSGTVAATSHTDGTVKLWQVTDGSLLNTLRSELSPQKKKDFLLCVRFSPNAKYIAACGEGSTAYVWSLQQDGGWSGPRALTSSSSNCSMCGIYNVAFTSDSKHLASIESEGFISVWNLEATNAQPTTLNVHEKSLNKFGDRRSTLSFSPDDKYIASVNSIDKVDRVLLWEWKADRNSTNPRELLAPGPVRAIAFDSSGKTIVAATDTGKQQPSNATARKYGALVFDVATGRMMAALFGHTDDVRDVTFSPDGNYVLTASHDGSALVFDWKDPDRINTPAILSGHTGMLYSAKFSPDGRYVVTASADNTARIWKPGLVLKEAGNNRIGAWSACLAVLRGHSDEITRAAFSPDGRRIITVSDDDTAKVWRSDLEVLSTTLQEQAIQSPRDAVDAAFSPDGKHVVTSGDQYPVRVWNADNIIQKPITLSNVAGDVTYSKARFSPDGQTVVVARNREVNGKFEQAFELWSWRGQRPEESRVQEMGLGHLNGINFSHDPRGRYLVTASGSDIANVTSQQESRALNVVRIWDRYAPVGTEPIVLAGHEEPVLNAVFSSDPESRYVATVGFAEVRIYEWRKGIGERQPINVLTSPTVLFDVAFSRNGQYVAAAGAYSAVVWEEWKKREAASSPLLLRVGGPWRMFHSISFSPDSSLVLTAGEDDSIRLWSPRSGANLSIVAVGDKPTKPGQRVTASFSPDGRKILVTYPGEARVYDCEECRRMDEFGIASGPRVVLRHRKGD